MANFCMKCGGALDAGAGFCKQCGSPAGAATPASAAPPSAPPPAAPVYAAPVYAQSPVAAAPAKSSSALKFVLIAFIMLAGLGMMAAVGAYYYAKSKISAGMAVIKDKTGVDVGAAIENASNSKHEGGRRDGCAMLSKEEAERIIGMKLARADGDLRNGDSEHCDYYAEPGAVSANAEQAMKKIQEFGKSDSSKAGDMKDLEGVVKGIAAGSNNGSVPVLKISFYRGDAQVAIAGFNLGTALGGTKPESVPGPWDEARMGPLNSSMTVLKGNNGFMIDLGQLPDGREKGLELAKTIVARF